MERAFLQLALYIMSFVFGFIQVVQIIFIKKLLLLIAFFPIFFNLDVLLRILVRHNQKILTLTSTNLGVMNFMMIYGFYSF